MKKQICMLAYTNYSTDARIRREAETLAVNPGFKVIVLTPKSLCLPRTYTMNGVTVIELNTLKYSGNSFLRILFSFMKFTLYSFLACTKLFLYRKVDIVHVHNMPNFLILSAFTPRCFGRKVIVDIHDTVPETYGAKFNSSSNTVFRLLCLEEFICCSFAHKIICVNEVQRDTLVRRGIPCEKIIISMNVPDHNIFDREGGKAYRGNADRSFKMVYHGTVTDRLGVDLAIEAVAHLLDKIPSLEFHIWGGGDYLNKCIELSRTLGMENHIRFHASVPVDFLPQTLKEMDLGIVPNKKTLATDLMLPVKLLEYVALGIPAVVPRLKTIEHYFSEDMVTYFEPENIDSMAEAIFKLYRDKSRRERQTQKAKAFLDKYGWETHQMDLINLYRNL